MQRSIRPFAFIALIILADLLIWRVAPGLALVVLCASALGAAYAFAPRPISKRRRQLFVAISALSLLPLVELVQPLSIGFAVLGIPIALAALMGFEQISWLKAALRFWLLAPAQSLWSAKQALRAKERNLNTAQLLRGWTLPVAVGLIFAGLILQANPVLQSLLFDDTFRLPHPGRVFLWTGIALFIWPMLDLARFGPLLTHERKAQIGPKRLPLWVNAEAIIRSLILFNLLFALQNAMDIAYLAGGARLPEGMTYAEYAHRGSYPLVALALLSGGFALMARPFMEFAPTIRILLILWMAQTFWLTCSSLIRLELYVEVYGLTRLRLAAAIWIGLVAAGLGLILWQIFKAESNRWMLARVTALGILVLYACCFVSFDRLVTSYNLKYTEKLDIEYICKLSEDALPIVRQNQNIHCRAYMPIRYIFRPDDWREWGFRNARTRRSLEVIKQENAEILP